MFKTIYIVVIRLKMGLIPIRCYNNMGYIDILIYNNWVLLLSSYITIGFYCYSHI